MNPVLISRLHSNHIDQLCIWLDEWLDLISDMRPLLVSISKTNERFFGPFVSHEGQAKAA
jgi:hypothetical protein